VAGMAGPDHGRRGRRTVRSMAGRPSSRSCLLLVLTRGARPPHPPPRQLRVTTDVAAEGTLLTVPLVRTRTHTHTHRILVCLHAHQRTHIQAMVVTAAQAAAAPRVGAHVQRLTAFTGPDDRLALLLWLVSERAAGADSACAPWLALWPASLAVPTLYDRAAWQALDGTALARAARAKVATLVAEAEALRADAEDAGAADLLDLVTTRAWVWADAAYRTRVCEGPLAGNADDTATLIPALVPGVDFANHAIGDAVTARWVVDAAGACVRLEATRPLSYAASPTLPVPHRGGRVCFVLIGGGGAGRAGTAVCISYGDKGTEELLYQYGFTLPPPNPHDRVVVPVPLAGPAAASALREAGLPPVLLLPADGDLAAAWPVAQVLAAAMVADEDAAATVEPSMLLRHLLASALEAHEAVRHDTDAEEAGEHDARWRQWVAAVPPPPASEARQWLADIARYRASQAAVLRRALDRLAS
jgi:hypothetical protein